jgi:predicted PurR-regulated permease PerM
MVPERVVSLRPRTVMTVLAVAIAFAAALEVVWIARTVITWILVALFLALALNPAVEWLARRTNRGRGTAVAVIFVGALLSVALLAALVIPTLVDQVDAFVQAVPGYVKDLTHGRGPLGFLETKYQVVEKVQDAVGKGGGGGVLSHAGVLVDVGRGIATAIAGIVTIIFLTLFMLLEGPSWVERLYGLVPGEQRGRWHGVGADVYRTVGGYVTGNLLISVICGVVYGVALAILGVPYPVALGFIVAILDLVPLAGATIGGLIVVGAAVVTSTTAGIVMAVLVILYQQVENHVLQPVIYGRTVNLSPLAVLISVLIGAEVAGVLGALGAIPIAGTIQVLLVDNLRQRRARREASESANRPSGSSSLVPNASRS